MSLLIRYVVSVFTVVSLLTTASQGVTARQSEGTFELGIVVANCEREPTSFPFQGGGCMPAEGAVIVVTISAGEFVGTCAAKATGPDAVIAGCSVPVPFGSTVIVTEDETTIPPNYAPTNNPQTFEVPTIPPDGEFGGPVFLNLPTENTNTSGIGLEPPIMAGGIGDVWEVDIGDDFFWWKAVDFGWIDSPAPRYVVQPHGSWFVVLIDLGTEDGWISNDFPYGLFALEDSLGNVHFPDITATSAYCDAYCDMDIEQQNFSGWVGHTFHQAIVFDVSATNTAFSTGDPGFTLRTLDGLIAVPLRTADEGGDRTVTIYAAECLPGYTGDASADECDANPVTGAVFQLGSPITNSFTDSVTTGDEGLVVFQFDEMWSSGPIRIIEELPAGTERVVVYCVDDAGSELGITYVANTVSSPELAVVDVTVESEGDILCDWYNVPVPD